MAKQFFEKPAIRRIVAQMKVGDEHYFNTRAESKVAWEAGIVLLDAGKIKVKIKTEKSGDGFVIRAVKP